MPRVRALHSAIILFTLAVVGIEYFGWEASLDPDPARQGAPAQILRRIAGPLLEAENLMRDAMMRMGRPAAPDPRLVFLALDNDSVSISSDDLAMLDTNSADAKSKRALTLMSR